MPNLEFRCKKCENIWDELTKFDKTGKYKKIKCPECNSTSKENLLSSTNSNFSNPIGTDRWTSDTQGHDYRYNFNKPNVRKQREAAEKASKVGKNPYGTIDDISSGKYFGEVK